MAPSPTAAAAVLVLAALACPGLATDRPVIGLLTQGVSSSHGNAYLAASYVKYIESSGAEVVPVFCDASEDRLTEQFKGLNGMLFPGGGQDLHDPTNTYVKAASLFFKLAADANSNGDYFPIWGTCLGFQMTAILCANHNSSVVVDGFDSENLPLPLTLTNEAASSRLFGSLPAALIQSLQTENVTMNNHQSGVTPATFDTNPALVAGFDVLSTNVDRNGRAFVSTFESKTLPIYATQWHPEKNSFEWTSKENIPHSAHAVAVTQAMSNFLVGEARKSEHVYDPELLAKDIIYNYKPVFTGLEGSGFEQSYFFP